MPEKPRKVTEKEFSELLLSCIDETLASLGANSRDAIYRHLEKNFQLSKQDIPIHFEEFSRALESLFGIGSKPLEVMIIQRLHSKMKDAYGPLNLKEFTLTAYVSEVKKNAVAKDESKKIIEAADKSALHGEPDQDKSFIELLNIVADPVVIVDPNGVFLQMNTTYERVMGAKKEEWIGKPFSASPNFPQTSKILLAQNLKKRSAGEQVAPYEVDIVSADGEVRQFEVNAKKIEFQGKPADMVISRDVTQRKILERQLKEHAEKLERLVNDKIREFKESEEKFRGIVESSSDVIILARTDGSFSYVSPSFAKLVGYSPQEITGATPSLIHPDDLKKVQSIFAEGAQGRSGSDFEYRVITKQDETKWVSHSWSPIFEDGKVKLVSSVIRDISERKKLENAIKQEHDMLEDVATNIGAGLVIVNKDYQILWANEYLISLNGNIVDKTCYKTFNTLGAVCPGCGPKKIFEGASHDTREYFNKPLYDKGLPCWFELISTPIKDETGNVTSVLELTVDITEKKMLESKLAKYSEKLEDLVEERTRQLAETQAKLVKSERLAAIGELAGMVGHDLRNPLTSIKGAAYFLRAKYGSSLEGIGLEMLQNIDNSIEYSNKIINDLLDYSREIKLELSEATPSALFKAALALLQVQEKIKVVDATAVAPRIRADTGKMTRVFTNLIKNAFDAMPQGGTLTVTSCEEEKNWSITFEDTGVGMSEDTMKHLWKPLFTTKAKGMGFGLSICKRIVEAHGGRIVVASAVNKGTTFKLTLPKNPTIQANEAEDMGVFSGAEEEAVVLDKTPCAASRSANK